MAAADLTTIDGKTSVAVTATAVTTVTGTSAEVDALATEIGAGMVTANNFATTPTDATTVAQANNIDLRNGNGQITSSISDGDISTLKTPT